MAKKDMTPVTVDISKVRSNTSRVATRDLAAGMTIWDIWGNEYTLDKVTHFKHGCRTYRSDGEVEWVDYLNFRGDEQIFTVRLPKETP